VRTRRIILVAAVVLAATLSLSMPTRAQEASGYEPLTLPSEWREFREKNGDVEKVEYIFRDRADALLRIKRVTLGANETIETVAEREMNGSLRYFPDYLFGKKEAFGGGNHAGFFVEFDYTRAKKPYLGRNYYLKGANSTVWVLQFSGNRTILKQNRNVTDQMARGFKEKG
jgi:hypothetical protein